MRTCYDSASAFAQLITHIANDTQRQIDINNASNETTYFPDGKDTFSDHEVSCNLTEEETNSIRTNNVNDLLAEAVRETTHDFGQKSIIECIQVDPSLTQNVTMNISDFEAIDVIGFESNFTTNKFSTGRNDYDIEQLPLQHNNLDTSVPTYHIFERSEDVSQELHFKSDDDYCIVDEKTVSLTCYFKCL